MPMEISLLPPASPVPLQPRPQRGLVRWALGRIRRYTGVQEPPADSQPTEQALYGLAQPLLGIRVLLSDQQLLREAISPAAVLALACALYASVKGGSGDWVWFKHFYRAFAALAPLPSFFFANHYARLAAMIRWRLGFGACGPREMPWRMLFGRMIRQALIVAIGIAPLVACARLVPGIGDLV